ncbi:hypothetical protein STENM327S_02309 [Streptomyces tendae]
MRVECGARAVAVVGVVVPDGDGGVVVAGAGGVVRWRGRVGVRGAVTGFTGRYLRP